MIINHNLNAMNAHRNMTGNTAAAGKSMEKLSSGLRINRAGDDAAGLAISEKMRGQIRGLDQASRNAQDSISLVQTAEGALSETHSILQRMRELAVQGANDTNTTVDRQSIQTEIGQLTSEIDRIAGTTEFNTKKLLNGDLSGAQAFQKGAQTAKEGTFANGSVALSAMANVSYAIATDVIKINIVKDTFTDGTSLSGGANISAGMVSITTVLGNFTGAIELSSNSIVLSAAGVDNTTNTTMDITIAIGNWKNLKAGDSITLGMTAEVSPTTLTSSNVVHAQIGANSGQELQIGINKMDSKSLGVRDKSGNSLDLTTQTGASGAVVLINSAIEKVSTERSNLGAYQNRLEHTINNLGTSSENLQASESRIRDVDMAKEMMAFSKNNVLTQAAQAMLAQANQAPQQVLQLLR